MNGLLAHPFPCENGLLSTLSEKGRTKRPFSWGSSSQCEVILGHLGAFWASSAKSRNLLSPTVLGPQSPMVRPKWRKTQNWRGGVRPPTYLVDFWVVHGFAYLETFRLFEISDFRQNLWGSEGGLYPCIFGPFLGKPRIHPSGEVCALRGAEPASAPQDVCGPKGRLIKMLKTVRSMGILTLGDQQQGTEETCCLFRGL